MFIHTGKFGGTEYMAREVNKFLPEMPKLKNYQLIVTPGYVEYNNPQVIDAPKIIWLHNILNQVAGPMVQSFFGSKIINNTVHYWIVPSEYAKSALVRFGIDVKKIVVIPNAIEPLQPNLKKWNNVKTVKAVYTSNLARGLVNLLTVWDDLDPDLTLDIFSEWHNAPSNQFEFNIDNWEKFLYEPRIRWYGRATNQTLRNHIADESHLFLYPSLYDETFCIAMAEAMSAGLKACTSSLDALVEIGGKHIQTFDWQPVMKQGIQNNYGPQIYGYMNMSKSAYLKDLKKFVDITNKSVADIKNKKWNPSQQVKYINDNYGWDTVKKMWLDFHDSLPNKPKVK